ncbi:cadherin-like beta sandwich domain-containing protein [Treponema sp. Marseille-Q4523]|uniref:cadherin-like beta sandwich domain-containing protein n=1 Tax=Treponema sp. Marseille-Q4523 TaxID=2810610 RepID=UPI0019611337|nr:cadherin-like beta sandwich domain-containing protein [Treponema sp. Marseille-Q4523]MBM7022985.1 cadherin-like beta sandwich domain-containing protein [Treponema sp. Marseille-Q4523]
MKKLQRFFYAILLFSGIVMSCNQNISSGGGEGQGASPGNAGWEKVKISVLDGNNQPAALTGSGNEQFTTIKTEKATVSVGIPLGAQVQINGEATRSKELTFATNGEEKTADITVTYNGASRNYKVKIRYYKGAIKKVAVTDEASNPVSVSSPDAFSYLASVGTKKATVAVETFQPADTVRINDEETKTKQVEFGADNKPITLTINVTHEGNEETYTVKIIYSDPNAVPKEPVLKSITVKNAENTSETFALAPKFFRYNTEYRISVRNSVNKIKVEAEPETGIDVEIDGGAERTLAEGNNTITVKAVQTGNTANAFEYKIHVQKAQAAASDDAFLKSLALDSTWGGLHKDWKTAPVPFDKHTDTYMCMMDAHCDEFLIEAVPNEEHAVMTVQANGAAAVPLASGENKKFVPLINGINTFVITVTAEDASTVKTYTVNAEKKEGSLMLKTFTVSGVPDFYTESYEKYKKGETVSRRFDIVVPETVIPVTVTAIPEFPATTTMKIQINKGEEKPFDGTQIVDFSDTWKVKGKPDNKDTVRLTIKLESSVISAPQDTYYLWLYKRPAGGSDDNTLKNLEVQYYGNGFKFYAAPLDKTFAPDTTDYSITLPPGVTDIRVAATPNHEKAYIAGWDGSKMNVFFAPVDKIEIPVVAENGTRKVYEITVKQKAQPTVKITSIAENQTIDLQAQPSGLSVSGKFEDPSRDVDSIWVGSSGLPIQKDKGGKWVQASISGNTFTAVLPPETLKDLPNGLRDIKAGAFDLRGGTLAVTRVPITVTGNAAVTAAPVTVRIQKAATLTESIPANASMSIIALDQAFFEQGEDVVYASKALSPIGALQFPTNIPLAGVRAGIECRVLVYVYERVFNSDVLLYFGDGKVQVTGGTNNACTVELKKAQ